MPDVLILRHNEGLTEAVGSLRRLLREWSVDVISRKDRIFFGATHAAFTMQVVESHIPEGTFDNILPLDYLVRTPHKVGALVLTRLGLNKRVFARNCQVQRIKKPLAKEFLDLFHLMGSTDAAYCYGLFLKEHLLSVATFSKGRKMRRLKDHERSYELIRFCTAGGITVTGGLSKMMRTFCDDRRAAEIMTYVDRQFSAGQAFSRAGFVAQEETPPRRFLVNRNTYERLPYDGNAYDQDKFYVTSNAGNIKMLFSCRSR